MYLMAMRLGWSRLGVGSSLRVVSGICDLIACRCGIDLAAPQALFVVLDILQSTLFFLGSTEGNKFRHIMFIIIESGMALFAIQLVRIVLEFISVPAEQLPFFEAAYDIVTAINQMLNVIIILRSSFLLLLFC